MARMSSRNRAEYDGDSSVVLRNLSAGAITVTTAEPGVSLQALTRAYWDNNEQPQGVFTVAVEVTNMIRITLENYTFLVEVAPTNAFVPAQTNAVYNLPIATAVTFPNFVGVGFYEFVVPYSVIEFLDPTAKFIRIRAVLAGGANSLTYGAHITFIDN
jgi:hypothetical protein